MNNEENILEKLIKKTEDECFPKKTKVVFERVTERELACDICNIDSDVLYLTILDFHPTETLLVFRLYILCKKHKRELERFLRKNRKNYDDSKMKVVTHNGAFYLEKIK